MEPLRSSMTGPTAQVEIKIMSGSEAGKTVFFDPQTFPFLSSAEFTEQYEANGLTSSIGIAAPFEEGMELLDGPLFMPGNVLRMRIGYSNGEMTKWVFGVMQEGGIGLSLGPDGLSGTVTAAITSEAHFMSSVSVIKDKTLADIVEDFAKSLSIKVPDGVVYENDVKSKRLSKKKDEWPGSGGMDMQTFICNELDFVGCRMVKTTDKDGNVILKIGSLAEKSTDAPVARFIMRGEIDTANNQYPLLSFSPEAKSGNFVGSFFPAMISRGASTAYVEEATGKLVYVTVQSKDATAALARPFDGTATPVEVSDTDTGLKIQSAPVEGETETCHVHVLEPAGGEEEMKEVLTHWVSEAKCLAGTNADFETIGLPQLESGSSISVENVGQRYAGNWTILETTHSWSSDGYQTSFKAYSLGQTETAGSDTKTMAGENTQPVATA